MTDAIPEGASIRKGAFAYVDLARILRSWIAEERFAKGEKLPTEDELMAMFKVGRHTVRSAVANLVEDGLVERFAGRGTFVTRIDVDGADWRIRSLEDIIDQNFPESAEIQEMRRLPGLDDPEAARALGLDMSDTLVQLTALRRREGRPYTFSRIFVPVAIGDRLGPDLRAQITDRPLVRVIERECGLRCARAVQETSATAADDDLAGLLQVAPGSPLITLRRTYYTSDAMAFEHVRLYGVPGLYSHNVEFSRARRG